MPYPLDDDGAYARGGYLSPLMWDPEGLSTALSKLEEERKKNKKMEETKEFVPTHTFGGHELMWLRDNILDSDVAVLVDADNHKWMVPKHLIEKIVKKPKVGLPYKSKDFGYYVLVKDDSYFGNGDLVAYDHEQSLRWSEDVGLEEFWNRFEEVVNDES